MNWKYLGLGVVLALSTLGAVVATPIRGFLLQQAPGVELYRADGFVPFVADFAITQGQPLIRGRFYRAADGSERTEQLEGSTRVVMIKNMPHRKFYTCDLAESDCLHGGQWVSQPMELGPGPHSPARWLKTDREERFVGHWRCVVNRSRDNRSVTYEAADLGYFPIRMERSNGAVIEYTNITLVEPYAGLFEPPAGSTVRISQTPGGIITRPYQGRGNSGPR